MSPFDFHPSFLCSGPPAIDHRHHVSEQDRPDVERQMAFVKQKITEAKAAMAQFQMMLSDYEGQLDSLQKRIQYHKNLPEELWSRVFSLVIGPLPLDISNITGHPIWTLRQVCARWRFIVSNNPLLRNSIKIEPPPTTLAIFDGAYNGLNPQHRKVWDRRLEKAVTLLPSACSVAVELDCQRSLKTKKFKAPSATRAIRFLTKELSPRITKMTLTASHSILWGFMDLPGYTHFEALTLKEVCKPGFSPIYSSPTSPSNDQPLQGLLQRSPKLKHLTLHARSHLLFPTSQPSCLLSSLIELTVNIMDGFRDKISAESMVIFLSSCQNLTKCSLHFHQPPRGPRWVASHLCPGRLRLPHLEILQLANVDPVFLDALTIPLLKKLSYGEDYPQNFRIPTESIINLVARSSCSINAFSHHTTSPQFGYRTNQADMAKAIHLPPEELKSLLTALHAVEALSTVLAFDEAVIRQIARGDLLSRLRSLSCGTELDPINVLKILLPRFGWKNPQVTHLVGLRKVDLLPYRLKNTAEQTAAWHRYAKSLSRTHRGVSTNIVLGSLGTMEGFNSL